MLTVTVRDISLRCVPCHTEFNQPTGAVHRNPITNTEAIEMTCECHRSSIWRSLS